MHARVARFEGAVFATSEERIAGERERIREVHAALASGKPLPEGIDEAGAHAIKRLIVLADRQTGDALSIVLCETEHDLAEADRMMNAMAPADGGPSGRVAVGFYEVVLDEPLG